MPPISLSANGIDLRPYGFTVERVDGWHTIPAAAVDSVPIYGLAGGMPTASGSAAGRLMKIVAWVRGDTIAARNAALDQVKDLLSSAILTLGRFDAAGRMATGILEGPIDVAASRLATTRFAQITFSIRCQNAWLEDVQPSTRALLVAATRYTLDLGTAPSPGLIRLRGTNPVLTYRDAGGTARKVMTFTFAPGANDYLEIDMPLRKIRQSLAGVVSNGRSLLTSGDFPWAFDPRDGNQLAGVKPTLEVSAGTGYAWWWRNWQ